MKIKQWGLAVALMCLSGHVLAADIKLRGFASFVGGMTPSSSDTLYGYEDKINFRNDSLIALQADAKLDEKISATMQFMSRGANDYEPVVEWAYVTYEFSDKLQLSGGRIRVPFYRYSDFIDVRYTYNWVKVPQTVYGFEFPGYDGLSMVYTNQFGGWESMLQIFYGQLEGQLGELDAVIEDLTGFSWTLNRDWLTLRAGYVSSKTEIRIESLEQLAAGVEFMGSQLLPLLGADVASQMNSLANDLRVDGDRGNFGGLALGIDYNNILFDAEYIRYDVEDSLLAETDAYYVSAGYRFGKWIPLVTYSESESESPNYLLNRIPAGAANFPFGAGSLAQVIGGAIAATEAETKLWEAGFRYDFHHSAAFKLAWTQTDDLNEGKNGLLRFAVDLVF